MTAIQTIGQCKELQKSWNTRRKKFTDWYNLILLKDELEQEGMESVVSNDPRTGFNLALHLLTNSIIGHKIVSDDVKPEQISSVSYVEGYVTKRWASIEAKYRYSGRQSWLRDMVSLMLATGWISVFSMVTKNEIITEVWHPANVFPAFGDDGLSEVAYIYEIPASAAYKKIKKMGWKLPTSVRLSGKVTIYVYWTYDADGDVTNSIVLDTNYVKEPVKELKLDRIPVFVSPVGGLPDRGSLAAGDKWQENYGECILATNEGVFKNYNKMITYQQQLMRDTANPRWFEQSRGDTPILTEENLFKRGAIFRGTPEEKISPLPTPPIPVELRTLLFDYGNMVQRGLFPAVLFGNIQQEIAGYAMSQVASAAMQVLTPYHLAIKGLLTDLDNFWYSQIKDNKYRPYNFEMPKNMPEDVVFDVDFNINIPGYLIQRATVARMLDPSFRLNTTTVMDLLFPEIKDPLKEQAGSRKNDAMMHPKAISVSAIIAYNEQAKVARNAGDIESAELFEILSESLKAELTAGARPPEEAAGAGLGLTAGPGGEQIPREALPREALQ